MGAWWKWLGPREGLAMEWQQHGSWSRFFLSSDAGGGLFLLFLLFFLLLFLRLLLLLLLRLLPFLLLFLLFLISLADLSTFLTYLCSLLISLSSSFLISPLLHEERKRGKRPHASSPFLTPHHSFSLLFLVLPSSSSFLTLPAHHHQHHVLVSP